MTNELLHQIALTLIPGIGAVQAKILIEHFGDATSVINAKEMHLIKMEGIGEVRAKAIKSFNNFKEAEEEIHFIEKYKIKPLFLTDKNYPQRLLNCYDSPTLLYYKGEADFNASKSKVPGSTRIMTIDPTQPQPEPRLHIRFSLAVRTIR